MVGIHKPVTHFYPVFNFMLGIYSEGIPMEAAFISAYYSLLGKYITSYQVGGTMGTSAEMKWEDLHRSIIQQGIHPVGSISYPCNISRGWSSCYISFFQILLILGGCHHFNKIFFYRLNA